MQVQGATSWQWKPKATVTAADSCRVCTALALEYTDCTLIRVRRNPQQTRKTQASRAKVIVEEPQLDDDELHDSRIAQEIELPGHVERITSMCVYESSTPASVTLCSASSDCVIVWQIRDFARMSKLVLRETLRAEPSSIAFDRTGTLVALCCDRVVQVFVIDRREVFVTLEGHLARIWDLAAKTLFFQSSVLSAFAILSLATNPSTGDFSIGFADGTIRIFSLLDNYAKEMVTVNVESFLRKLMWKKQRQEEIQDLLHESPNVISSLPPWARSEQSQETAQIQAQVRALTSKSPAALDYTTAELPGLSSPSHEFKSEIACPILASAYFCVDTSGGGSEVSDNLRTQFNSHGEQELIGCEQFLVVGTPRHVLYVNAFSFDISILLDLQRSTNDSLLSRDPVCMAKEFCFHQDTMRKAMICGVVSAFQPCFTALCSVPTGSADRGSDKSPSSNQANDFPATGNPSRISVLPTGPPPPDSVLNLPSLAVVAGSKLPKKGAKSLDKPITFHTRVKSSGYGSSVPFGMKRTSIQDRKTPPRPKAVVDTFLKEYPSQCGVLQHFQQKHALARNTLHSGAIHHIEFASDAKWLATSGNDKVAQVCKLPFSRFNGEGNVFVGHDNAVRSIHWSQNNQMVVTTSSDKSARVWLADSDVASLTFHGVPPVSTSPSTGRLQSGAAATTTRSFSSAKKAIKQEMVDAMFFYMDKFILSGCGNAIRLHQFELDELYARAQKKRAKKNDILVDDNKSRKKKVAEWGFEDMQSLTALACVNGSFLSSVIIAAGSDRSVRILDAAVGKTLRVISDAHTRAAHTVALPKASCFTSHPSNFYDLLLSSAPNSTIHLWDIRADNCVMRFGEHVNRVHQLGVAFSPCMRYVATGSEDRMGYLYDIRTGRCLQKLAGHTDVVTSVAFNPLYPQLATSSYDSTVRFYSDCGGE